MNEAELRQAVVSTARSLLGQNEADGSFRPIIDGYNAHKPLPRGYPVKYTDQWCATFVSYVGYRCGLQAIIHPECGCEEMVRLYRAEGRWVEDDAYRPLPGDIILYNWQAGPGPNTGVADHVGIVAEVEGSQITVIEGNKGEAVRTRQIPVEYVYTRGFCLPDYAAGAVPDSWQEAGRSWAMAQGITDGLRPGEPVTREELWETLRRLMENRT